MPANIYTYHLKFGNDYISIKTHSRLSVLRGINIIGFERERSNFKAGEPSISVVVNHFSEFVTWSFNFTTPSAFSGTRPIK